VWEDPQRVVFTVEDGWQIGIPVLRLDVRTGQFENVPLPPATGAGTVLVEPWFNAGAGPV
jgi:hypothetical protein